MIRPMKLFALLVAAGVMAGCAGYHLGSVKPASLTKVNTIAVPMFTNATLHPRAEALATSAVANAVVQDGTYRLTSVDRADAVLEGKLSSISYSAITNNRFDTLKPEELANTVTIQWTLRDARNPTRVLASGVASGSSQFSVAANLQTARNDALPDALERAGVSLVSSLANGY